MRKNHLHLSIATFKILFLTYTVKLHLYAYKICTRYSQVHTYNCNYSLNDVLFFYTEREIGITYLFQIISRSLSIRSSSRAYERYSVYIRTDKIDVIDSQVFKCHYMYL